MSKGQTKKTREAAGNRRKLTRAEKKQIAEVIQTAKGDGKPHTAQQTIPYMQMFPDGICHVSGKRYSKTVAFEDINYQLAQADDKTAIFENWCDFLNYFDASVQVQLSFINQGGRGSEAESAIHIPTQDDAFNSIRNEYADMLKNQLAKGNNGLVKHKYITFSIEADSMNTAKSRLARIETDILNNFKVLGVSAHPMTGYRLTLKGKPDADDEDSDFVSDVPDFTEGQTFSGFSANVTAHDTQPPKPHTEASLLSAMEHAGSEDTNAEAERKGLGTPATRAAVIEKLVNSGFVERKGKQLFPTKNGINLVCVLPDNLTSPKLTAEWENTLTLIAKGNANPEDFAYV